MVNYDEDEGDAADLNENEHRILTTGNELQSLNIIQQSQSDGKPEFTNNVSKVAGRGGDTRDSLDLNTRETEWMGHQSSPSTKTHTK